MRKNKIVAAAASLVVGSGLLLGSQYVTALEGSQGPGLNTPEGAASCMDGDITTGPVPDSLCYTTILDGTLGDFGALPGQIAAGVAYTPESGDVN